MLPIPILEEPPKFDLRDCAPIDIFSSPLVFCIRAYGPIAILLSPVTTPEYIDPIPIAVLLAPSVSALNV